ncbi:hypothetical protein ACGFYU_05785 [Streptomyces sp. NPDC048337]|uniref:hypothetical protein n=1 Tax=Streptomyces sp. NPDC048337 TaxID=3365535 RepID=UPI0037203A98
MNIKYRVAAAALAAAAVAAAVVPAAMAAPAYKCASSTKDIDDSGYDGPWPDNWKVTVKTCAARSGNTVYAYAEVKWDGTRFREEDDPTIFDGAKLRLQIKLSSEGTDSVVIEGDFTELERRMGNSTSGGNYDGHYRTPTLSHRAGPGALADSVLFLDWHGDGRGYGRHDYTGSPTV